VPRLRITSSNWKKNPKSLPDAQPHLWYYALSIAENSFLGITSTREDPKVDLCHLGLEITIYSSKFNSMVIISRGTEKNQCSYS
jgi:hypothetical protein